LTGLEASGKSLIAAHMMANVQKDGGVAVLIDTENAINPEFYNAIGLNIAQLVYAQPGSVEDIFECIEKVIDTVRKKQENKKKVIIVVDSIAAASTKEELEGTYDKSGYGTVKAQLLGKAFRKITNLIGKEKIALVFTNQLRQKMNAPAFSDPWTTPGGKALPFAASTRVRLSITGKIKNKSGDVVGVKVKAIVIKNRLGPPFKVAEFNIFFDRGIDDDTSCLEFLKQHDVVSSGASMKYIDVNGEEHKFNAKEWSDFFQSHKAEIYQKMCDAMIMTYSTEQLEENDMSIDDGAEE
jgi:recombination protein RecA